ncbi:hypothetical protein N9L68_08055 [bacterium]|nr:hypothetical protein [bacterium]
MSKNKRRAAALVSRVERIYCAMISTSCSSSLKTTRGSSGGYTRLSWLTTMSCPDRINFQDSAVASLVLLILSHRAGRHPSSSNAYSKNQRRGTLDCAGKL